MTLNYNYIFKSFASIISVYLSLKYKLQIVSLNHIINHYFLEMFLYIVLKHLLQHYPETFFVNHNIDSHPYTLN